MIKFTVRESMLDQDKIYLQWTIEGEKQPKSRKVLTSAITQVKAAIVRQEVIDLSARLFKQRYEAYRHSGYNTGDVIPICIELERQIPELQGILNMSSFFNYMVDTILPNLKVLAPGKDSRFKAYNEKLEIMTAFCKKCQAYYNNEQIAKNRQFAINQGVTVLNKSSKSISLTS